MMPKVLHGLLQKARLDAMALTDRMIINSAGQIWKKTPNTYRWYRAGDLPDQIDREDFLVAQLTQEER